MKLRVSNRVIYKFATVILLAGLVFSCKKSSPPAPAPSQGANEVWIQNMSFSPAMLSVSVNTTVVWTNNDADDHTVNSDSSLFDSGRIGNGKTYSRQFTTAGTFPYHCILHAGMNGKVVVN